MRSARFPYRTDHTNPFNRPDIGLSDDAKWCSVCRCWDLGLVEDEVFPIYRHAGETPDPDRFRAIYPEETNPDER